MPKKSTCFTLLCLLCSLFFPLSFCYGDYLDIGVGEGRSRYPLDNGEQMTPNTYSISYQRESVWHPFDIKMDLRTSYHHWDDPFLNRKFYALSVIPVWQIPLWQHKDIRLNLDVGIGAAYLSQKHWMDRRMGSHLQFADQAALSLHYKNWVTSFHLTHFSNANIAHINHGANIYQVHIGYKF